MSLPRSRRRVSKGDCDCQTGTITGRCINMYLTTMQVCALLHIVQPQARVFDSVIQIEAASIVRYHDSE
jgi:hypothetical protein